MTSFTLRPRQTQAITDLRHAYRSGYRAPILVAPTGFGKTATAVEIVRSAVARGRRVGFLAHLREILDDTTERLLEAGISHGSVRSGRSSDYGQAVQVLGVQTAVGRRQLPPLDLLIIDECHLAVARSYQRVIEALGFPNLLGLTGTPQRLDGRGLREVFDHLVPTCSTAELIEEGLLAPIRLFAPELAHLPDRRGKDFNQEEDGSILSAPAIVGDALSHWKRLCQGRRGVAFCASVPHAQAVAEQWRRAGYRAMAVHGDSDDADRQEAVRGLRAGRLDLVACAQLWIAGVDVPEIDVVIWLRRTTSVTAWLQGNGRGLRTAPGKTDLLIIDHVGNSDPARLDHPLIEREWSLDGKAKKKQQQSISVKVCPKCFASMPSAKPRCSECGHVFSAAPRAELQQIDGELVERRIAKFSMAAIYQAWPNLTDRQQKAYEIIENKWNCDKTDAHYSELCGESRGLGLKCLNKEDEAIARNVMRSLEKLGLLQSSKIDGAVFYRPIYAPSPKAEQGSAQTIADLVELGRRRGMKSPHGWARHVWAAREAKAGRAPI